GAIAPLRRLMASEDPQVRAFASIGLAVLDDEGAVPSLRRSLEPSSGQIVQRAAAWALGYLGGAEDEAPLAALLIGGEHLVGVAAAHALGARSSGRSVLIGGLMSADKRVQRAALVGLARSPDAATLPLLGARMRAGAYLDALID